MTHGPREGPAKLSGPGATGLAHRFGCHMVADLLRAAHPGPSLVVTAVTAGLAVSAAVPASTVGLLVLATLSGQLSVGWSNDWIDARRGRDRGREDKPIIAGDLDVRVVRRAALVAVVVAVLASVALGPVPGTLHLGAVGVAWAYNLHLKATVASVLAYMVAFAALPAVVTTAAGAGAPPPWAVLAAVGFGAGVHLSNALPDIAADRGVGVGGLPQRLGEWRSAAASVVLLGLGAAAALLGPFGSAPPSPALLGLTVATAFLAGALVAARRGRMRMARALTVAVGLLVVAALVAAGGRMV